MDLIFWLIVIVMAALYLVRTVTIIAEKANTAPTNWLLVLGDSIIRLLIYTLGAFGLFFLCVTVNYAVTLLLH